MPISITSGKQVRRYGSLLSATTQGPATSTATQTLTIDKDVVEFTGPTATISNWYILPAGDEGQVLSLRYLATGAGGTTASAGDIQVVASGTATGELLWPATSITFREVDDFWLGQFIAGKWRTVQRSTWENGNTTASGSIPVTVDAYRLTRATGTDMVFSLADGLFEGQRLLITALSGTAVRTVTPTTANGYTSIQMGTLAGLAGARAAMLTFSGGAWQIASPIGALGTSTSTDARDLYMTT